MCQEACVKLLSGKASAKNVGCLAACVVVPDDAVDNFGYRHVLGLGFDLLDEGFFNVQRPALGRSRGLIRGAEEVFPLSPPCENFLEISEIRERDVNVDICGSACVDFSGAVIVYICGLDWKCSF
jgi:hypothetical protein